MKRWTWLAAAVAALALTSTPSSARPVWLGLEAGFGLPAGDFSDAATSGWNAGITGDMKLRESFAVGGELSWHSFAGSDDLEKAESVAAGVPVDIHHALVPVLAHAKYWFPASQQLRPYAVGGLGVYHLSSKVESSSGDSDHSENKFGFSLGGGADFKGSESVTLGFEARYHWAGSGDEALNLLTVRGHALFAFGR